MLTATPLSKIADPNEKKLYAIAYEYRVKWGVWAPAMLYVHALDAGDARVQYLQSDTEKNMAQTRIVGIAPAVGFHVHDEHGERLSA